jgi:hypothetical protein
VFGFEKAALFSKLFSRKTAVISLYSAVVTDAIKQLGTQYSYVHRG